MIIFFFKKLHKFVDSIGPEQISAVDHSVDPQIEPVAYPGIFFWGVQQIQLRIEDREDGDLGAVAH